MAKFTENGFCLEYPDEWELEYSEENLHDVTLYSPNGAFWSLTRRPHFVEPEELLKESIETLSKEYEWMEISTAVDLYGDVKLDGFDLDFFYLDLPCFAMLRAIRAGLFTYFVYVQTMDQSPSMMDELKEITCFWLQNVENAAVF